MGLQWRDPIFPQLTLDTGTMTVCATVLLPQTYAPPLGATDPGSVETTTVNKVKLEDNPECNSNEASLPNGVTEENMMPPNLETFIPAECLPDVIDVYIDDHFIEDAFDPYLERNVSTLQKQTERKPIKFVRQYPACTHTDEGGVNGSIPSIDVPDRDCPKRKVLTGELDLRHYNFLGKGHHSKVVLAPFTIPSAPSPHAVAVKFSIPYADYGMLPNEAKIYNAFPRNLQDGEIPVVPKFYGYYAPSTEALEWDDNGNNGDSDDLEVNWKAMRNILLKSNTSILLVEACGKQVNACSLSRAARQNIAKLMNRLHEANFIQGSFYERNILVQPGPLTLPRSDRSLDKPSYRIIDFGRGENLGIIYPFQEFEHTQAEEEQSCARLRGLID